MSEVYRASSGAEVPARKSVEDGREIPNGLHRDLVGRPPYRRSVALNFGVVLLAAFLIDRIPVGIEGVVGSLCCAHSLTKTESSPACGSLETGKLSSLNVREASLLSLVDRGDLLIHLLIRDLGGRRSYRGINGRQ